jgi:predicted nucleotide-binding protein
VELPNLSDAIPVQQQPPAPPTDLPTSPRGKGHAIFVGHGKNKKPLEQLENILNEYGIPYKVAIDEANQGRPISEKVAQVMEECGAAILLFTADEEFPSVAGDVIWRPSENVVYELGASSVMYGRRIIIFKEHAVRFPSNFRDIGYISFEKDQLDGKAIELFRELIAFRIIQVTVPT